MKSSPTQKKRRPTEAELDDQFERDRTTWRVVAESRSQPGNRLLWSEKLGFMRETRDLVSDGEHYLYHDPINLKEAHEALCWEFFPEVAWECLEAEKTRRASRSEGAPNSLALRS